MKIENLVEKAHSNARKKGFWEDWEFLMLAASEDEWYPGDKKLLQTGLICTRLLLIVSEATEAMEAMRNGNSGNLGEELADIVIRVADLCGGLNIDLEGEIVRKMAINKDRPIRHGKRF